ncbi:hypothetical protein [Cellulomonas sp. B6]|uniref:DUF7657 domain-containing protein n=1 Tax=Cellulomonas sp. B6 TaxID=1295626 RepID=UPI00073C0A7D|nr:hypothetical protein [Cellulomonas sp. B6]KSW29264.1 hypothetical protein ATM99_08915 [Cellulomonas sp. B6]
MNLPVRLRSLPWRIVGPLLAYLVLVLLGVSTSSIGIGPMRQDPAHPTGIQLGESLSVRSDEFLTGTPMNLGVLATGEVDSLNPLVAPHGFTSQLSSGAVSSVVFFDSTVLRLGPFLPDAMLLAARWWLPFLLLALGAPAFFRAVTGDPRIGWFAAALMVTSPGAAWWSFGPINMLGFTLAGTAALQNAAARWDERRKGVAVAWAAASAVLLARTPLHYQPWAIVVATAILLVGVLALVVPAGSRRTHLAVVGATGASAVALLAGVVLENRASIEATLATVYPGARVATGGPVSLGEIFGATSLGSLEYMPIAGATNNSEVSSSFAVAAVWVVLLLARGIRPASVGHRVAVWAAGAASAFWFAWSLVDFGGLGERIPIVSMVPPQRSADVLGFLSIVLLCLVLPAAADRSRWTFAALCGGTVGLVAAHGASILAGSSLPELSTKAIWLTSAATALCVGLVTFRRAWWGGYALTLVLTTLLVWRVNPILVGLGDLRGTPVAEEMIATGAQLRAEDEVWATDSPYVDSLFMATGVPSLSGRQLSGPDVDAWRTLDPDGDEVVWNRGGSFIWFDWTDDEDLSFSNPSPDIISVTGSPCTVAERVPELTAVVSGERLDLPCLVEDETFQWGGAEHRVYDVVR